MRTKITGTLINYYFHCKRQCFLAYERLNMEDNSEDVLIGRALHEFKYKDDEKSEISIGQVKIDKITGDYVVEYKKKDSDIEAVKWQLLFYLYMLKKKGVEKKGKIVFEDAKEKKVIYVELTDAIEKELLRILGEIEEMLEKGEVPEFIYKKHCDKCAYVSYCKI